MMMIKFITRDYLCCCAIDQLFIMVYVIGMSNSFTENDDLSKKRKYFSIHLALDLDLFWVWEEFCYPCGNLVLNLPNFVVIF